MRKGGNEIATQSCIPLEFVLKNSALVLPLSPNTASDFIDCNVKQHRNSSEICQIRMHSSRMHAVHCSDRPRGVGVSALGIYAQGGVCLGGMCVWPGGSAQKGCLPIGVSAGGVYTSPCGQNDRRL